MKIVQILDNKVLWVSPYTKDDLFVSVNVDEDGNDIIEPRFAPDIIFVEAPNDVTEGDFYDPSIEIFTSQKDMLCYAQIDEHGEVVRNDIYSKNVIESDYLVQLKASHGFPPLGSIYYDGEFTNFTSYISKRLEKIEGLLKKK